MSVVHVIRDGRDIAFSKQQRRKYQLHYISLIKQQFHNSLAASTNLSTDGQYALDVARAWQWINEGIQRWAKRHENDINYVWVRLEDLCRPETRMNTTMKIMRVLGKTPSFMKRFVSSMQFMIDEQRCNMRKYLMADPELVRLIDDTIRPGLNQFGYPEIDKDEVFGGPLNNDIPTTGNPLLQRYISELSRQHPVTVLFVYVTRSYTEMFLNWLLFLLRATRGRSAADKLPVIVHTNDRQLFAMLLDPQSAQPTLHQHLNILNQITVDDCPVRLFPLLCDQPECQGDDRHHVWEQRISAALQIIKAGLNLVLTDVDALWVTDLLRLDLQWTAGGPQDTTDAAASNNHKTNVWQQFDIVASRGRFPYELDSAWGGGGTGKR
jgi:hypothetical protein